MVSYLENKNSFYTFFTFLISILLLDHSKRSKNINISIRINFRNWLESITLITTKIFNARLKKFHSTLWKFGIQTSFGWKHWNKRLNLGILYIFGSKFGIEFSFSFPPKYNLNIEKRILLISSQTFRLLIWCDDCCITFLPFTLPNSTLNVLFIKALMYLLRTLWILAIFIVLFFVF